MTAVTFPLCLPRLAFAICGWRWQNDLHEIKYSVCIQIMELKEEPFNLFPWRENLTFTFAINM